MSGGERKARFVKKNYDGLDVFRIIAAVMVAAIHTSPLCTYSATADFLLTRVICRLAVPFFFMVAGQFLLTDIIFGGKSAYRGICKYLKKLLVLYAFSTLLYIPIGIYAGHYQDLNLFSILRMLVFDGTFYHLWYFPACIIGLLMVCLLRRILNVGTVGVVAGVLYFIGLLGDSYYGMIAEAPILRAVYDGFFVIFGYTRNGIFMAPLFLLLGAWIGYGKQPDKVRRNVAGFVVFLLAMIAEGMLLRQHQLQRHDSMYLALPGCVFFLYCLLSHWQPCGKSVQGFRKNTVGLLRQVSLWMYILHPGMIVVVRWVARLTDSREILVENSLFHFLVVVVLSVVGAMVCARLQSWLSQRTGGMSIPFRIGTDKKQDMRCGRAWIELDKQALRHNVDMLQKRLPQQCALMPAVKANAYGHGALLIAGELNRMGIQAFCIACVEEGIALRRGGIKGEILILGYTHPEKFFALRRYRLTQTVVNYDYACRLNAYGRRLHVHIGIDTGMHRLGEDSNNLVQLCKIFEMRNLIVDGAFTHLCADDSKEFSEQSFTHKQADAFYKVIAQLREKGYICPKLHIQSSYSVLNYPELTGDYARVGIALYGVLSDKEDADEAALSLQPILSLKTRVAVVKEIAKGDRVGYGQEFIADRSMKIATLTIGYGDGLPRCLSSGVGAVLLHGHRASIIGRICMDQTIVDITGIPGVKAGDEAVLIGASGGEQISVYELASECGTITNEILSRLGARLERVII